MSSILEKMVSSTATATATATLIYKLIKKHIKSYLICSNKYDIHLCFLLSEF